MVHPHTYTRLLPPARDPSWSFGSTWGCLLMGWAQLLSLALATNPDTGCAAPPPPPRDAPAHECLPAGRPVAAPHHPLATPPRPTPASARFLALPAFAGLTGLLAAYLLWVVTSDARAKGLASALGSYADVFSGGKGPWAAREWDP